MIRRLAAVLLVTVGLVVAEPYVSTAHGCSAKAPTLSAAAQAGNDFLSGEVRLSDGNGCSSTETDSHAGSTLPPGHYETDSLCHPSGTSEPLCGAYGKCADGTDIQTSTYQLNDGGTLDPTAFCPSAGPSPTSTSVPIDPAAELKKVPLPASTLHFQPVDHRMLVHFKSNFYADGAPFDTTIKPLGHTMEFKGTATQFVWTFGDGTTLTTSTPGAPYPKLLVTHEYLRTGVVNAKVDTVYSASYRLDGGPWTPVVGTATSSGAPVAITVLEATPVLTD